MMVTCGYSGFGDVTHILWSYGQVVAVCLVWCGVVCCGEKAILLTAGKRMKGVGETGRVIMQN